MPNSNYLAQHLAQSSVESGHNRLRECQDEPSPKRRRVADSLPNHNNNTNNDCRSLFLTSTKHSGSVPCRSQLPPQYLSNSPTKHRTSELNSINEAHIDMPPLSLPFYDSQEYVPFIKPGTDLFILDTNWIIRYYDYLYALLLPQTKGAHIIIPNQITIELDRLKLRARPDEKVKFQRACKCSNPNSYFLTFFISQVVQKILGYY